MTAIASGDRTNLVLYRQFSPLRLAAPCPNPRPHRRLVNHATGLSVPMRCRRYSCPACLPVLVSETARALRLAGPTHFVTLTQVGHDWPTVQTAMTRLRARLARCRVHVEWAYCVEPHAVIEALHIHALVIAPDAAFRREIRGAATRVGMGWKVDVQRADAHRAHFYPMKEAMSSDPAAVARYWRINGNRLVHATHGFWRDASGARLQGVRAARKAARSGSGDAWSVYAP